MTWLGRMAVGFLQLQQQPPWQYFARYSLQIGRSEGLATAATKRAWSSVHDNNGMVTAMIVQGHDDQLLTSRDIEVVRAAIKGTRRLVLGVALATPLAAAGVMYLLVARQGSTFAALFVAAIFLGLGIPVFVGWWRRYRRILGEIEQVEMRIRAGEEVAPSSLAGK